MPPVATPIGVNDITSISRRYIADRIYDNVYKSNPLFFRWDSMGKKIIDGGFQLEVPVIYADIQAGGPYSGYAVLDVSPNDTMFNLAFPWSQYYTAVSFSGLDLARAAGPAEVASLVRTKLTQADMSIKNRLGSGLWSLGTNPDDMVGVPVAVDNGSLSSTYGGVSRTTYGFLNAQIDNSTTTLTGAAIQNLFGLATFGGRSPSIGFCTQPQYNVAWGLYSGSTTQIMPVQPGMVNEQLAQAGFSNILVNGMPLLVESHINTASNSYGKFVMLDEDYWELYVNSRVDIYLEDFQTPINQDTMTAKILWYGQPICASPQTQAKFTALTA